MYLYITWNIYVQIYVKRFTLQMALYIWGQETFMLPNQYPINSMMSATVDCMFMQFSKLR